MSVMLLLLSQLLIIYLSPVSPGGPFGPLAPILRSGYQHLKQELIYNLELFFTNANSLNLPAANLHHHQVARHHLAHLYSPLMILIWKNCINNVKSTSMNIFADVIVRRFWHLRFHFSSSRLRHRIFMFEKNKGDC